MMLLSIGKPIIDIIVSVNKEFLSIYDLPINGANQATDKEKDVFDKILQLNPRYIPGGSVTNTLRIFKWASNGDGDCFYIGLIGNDRLGYSIKDQLNKENIRFHFFEQNHTVQCAVLVSENGKHRSLLTNSLLISGNVEGLHLELSGNMQTIIKKCSFFYAPTFSLGSFSKQVIEIADHFYKNNKKIIINLGATYILQKYVQNSTYLFKISDVVIGNEEEYRTVANIFDIPQAVVINIENLLRNISSFIEDDRKMLIVTNGSKQVVLYHHSKIKYYQVPHIENLIDTTGAGDAFAGGFLAEFVKESDPDICIQHGIKCASAIVQVYGCDIDSIIKKTIL